KVYAVYFPKLLRYCFADSKFHQVMLYGTGLVMFSLHTLTAFISAHQIILNIIQGHSHLSSSTNDFRRYAFERLLNERHPVQPLANEILESLQFQAMLPGINEKTDRPVVQAYEHHKKLLQAGLVLVGEQIDYRVGTRGSETTSEI